MARQLAYERVSEPSGRWSRVTPLIDLPPRIEEGIARLRELSQLPKDWDGYGSPAITSEAKQGAMALLVTIGKALLPAMQLDPVSGGGVQFEWQIGPRSLEIEVLPDGSIEFLVVEGSNMLEGSVNDQMTVVTLLRWLMRS